MSTYFISDTHFGHTNIIRYCNRPFASAEEMDEEMIRRWNERVKPEDTVWHLGDFALAKYDRVRELVWRLNGDKYLLMGNHDRHSKKKYQDAGFSFVFQGYKPLIFVAPEIALSHRPQEVAPRPRPWLHGHVHNAPDTQPGVYNISVERTDYRPVTLEEILAR